MLELRNISKSFPGVKALDDVSVAFEPGEIHALVGENGAGKSTLMKIVTGIYQADAGEILFDGAPLRFHSYRDSLAAGIGIVHQEIQVVPESTVAETIMLDKIGRFGPAGHISWRAVNERALEFMRMVQLDVPPDTLIRSLSAAQKRLAQIAQVLSGNAKVILLDEPTSALTEHEAKNLFGILRDLKTRGVTLVFVSHKFEEVLALCDRASVLRDGQLVGTRDIQDVTRDELVQLMVGRKVLDDHLGKVNVNRERVVLEAEGVTAEGQIHDASFALHEGEILGFYGLVGAGRTELARVLIGEKRLEAGTVKVNGAAVVIRSVSESLYKHRLGYVTENRKEEGLHLTDTLRDNICITIWPRIINRFTRCISPRREAEVSRRMIDAMDIRTPGLEQIVENLSGGNQQKVSLAKWLAADCDIFIIDEPTVGVDVGAKGQIHELIRELAEGQRKAVILISSDMPEIVRLANRILVFRDHRIVGEIDGVDDPGKTYDDVSMAIGQHLH